MNLEYDWLHNQIVCDSPPTLYLLSTVKKAVNLWNEEAFDFDKIDEVNRNLQDKVRCLEIPKTSKNELSQTTEFVGIQLKAFLSFLLHESTRNFDWAFLKDKIHWTPLGTIDGKKTAEALVNSTGLTALIKFYLAVDFFLVDQINELAIQMLYTLEMNQFLLDKIEAIDGADIARQHFNISFNGYYNGFSNVLFFSSNAVGWHYYFQRLTEEEKVYFLNPQIILKAHFYGSNNLFFLFAQHDKQSKRQLLQDEEYCCYLLDNLGFEWFSVFYAFLKDNLEFFSMKSLAYLFEGCGHRFKSIIVFKNDYLQLCVMILQALGKRLATTVLDDRDANFSILRTMYDLMVDGELKLIKDFLKSVNSEWLKQQFSRQCYADSLAYLLVISLQSELLEFIIHFAFPIDEQRKAFLDQFYFSYVILEVIRINCKHDFDIDAILSVLFTNTNDITSYKRKLVKDVAFFSNVISDNWKIASKFVHSCFASQEEIFEFLKESFQKELLAATTPNLSKFIKETLVNQSHKKEIICDACMVTLSGCYVTQSKSIFELLDSFLFDCLDNSRKNVTDLKKELFVDKDRKLYLAGPLEFLKHVMEVNKYTYDNWNQRDESWRQMVDDLFHWICSSDENLKAELEE